MSDVGRRTVTGTLRVFAAEALLFPTGLVTVAVLTRWLGPGGYGLFTLVATIVAWVEWTVASVSARTAIKLLGESERWKPLASRLQQLNLGLSLAAAAALWLAAPVLADVLDAPPVAGYLRLFAIDVPLFTIAHLHRNILTGRGEFERRAVAVALRWIARMVLIVGLVGLGLSITGAILGSIGASLVELIVIRRYDRARTWTRTSVPLRPIVAYALPLFLFAASGRIHHQVDLLFVKGLGGTTAMAGFYGGAQNLSMAPGVFAVAFSPLLLATLSRLRAGGALDHAREMGRDSLRLVLVLVPYAGLTAGAAGEIVRLVFGPTFAPAGPLLARLIFAGVGGVMISVATAILTAAGKPDWTFRLVGPLVPAAVLGHLVAIPRWGPIGAAWVTALVGAAGAVAALVAVHRLWRIRLPAASLARTGLLTLLAWLAARAWPAESAPAVVLELAVLGLAIPAAYWALAEFGPREIELLRSLLRVRVPGRRAT